MHQELDTKTSTEINEMPSQRPSCLRGPRDLTVRQRREAENANIPTPPEIRATTQQVFNDSFLQYLKEKLCCGTQHLDDESPAQSSSGLLRRQARLADRSTGEEIELNNREHLLLEFPVLKEFEQIGGNVKLTDARIICLGNNHANEMHSIHSADLINSLAEENDIILVEGVEAHQVIEQENFPRIKAVSKKVRVMGWDNMDLVRKTAEKLKIMSRLIEEIEITKKAADSKALTALQSQVYKLDKEAEEIGVQQRNVVLKETLDKIQRSFPTQRIFVLAGKDHFSNNIILRDYLLTKPYITLQATHELSRAEYSRRAKEMYGSSSSTSS